MDPSLRRVRSLVNDIRVFESSRSRRRFLVHTAIAVIIFVLLIVLVRRHIAILMRPKELQTAIREFGIFGPLVLVVLQAFQVVAAPVPGQVLAVVAGYLYGAWWGTLYNMVGVTIGSTLAFWLSRRYGRPYVERVIHEDTLAKFDAIDDTQTRLVLFLSFLLPGLPDDALCFIGGLTRLPLWQLVVIAVVGRTPAFFLTNVIGEFFDAGRFEAGLVLAAVISGISVLAYLYHDNLLDYFNS